MYTHNLRLLTGHIEGVAVWAWLTLSILFAVQRLLHTCFRNLITTGFCVLLHQLTYALDTLRRLVRLSRSMKASLMSFRTRFDSPSNFDRVGSDLYICLLECSTHLRQAGKEFSAPLVVSALKVGIPHTQIIRKEKRGHHKIACIPGSRVITCSEISSSLHQPYA